jgi:tetratricopeptide (TPR) repeat protein
MNKNIEELERSLEQSENDAERLEALLALLLAHKDDDFVEGWKFGTEALELAKLLKNRNSVASAHEGLANVLWKLAEYSQSVEHFEEALDRYLGLGDLHAVARCYCGMGIISGSLQEYRTALEYFEDGLSASRRADRHQLAATITGNIGHVYFNMGRYKDAMDCFQHGLDFYQEINETQGIANMLGGMAGVHVYQGEYDKGMELVRRGLEAHKITNHRRGIAVSMLNIGNAFHRMGKLDKAKIEMKGALNYCRSINLKMMEYEVLKNLSEVCSDLKQEEEASKYLRLYMDGQKEEKALSVKRKNEQFKQRQLIREMQNMKK